MSLQVEGGLPRLPSMSYGLLSGLGVRCHASPPLNEAVPMKALGLGCAFALLLGLGSVNTAQEVRPSLP